MINVEYKFKKTTSITPRNYIGTCLDPSLRAVVVNNDANCRYVAENGSDTTGSGTLANPWKTAQHAKDNLGGRLIITFIRNGIFGEIHSYQNIWCNQNAFPNNLVIQVESGEDQIHVHWKDESVVTLAPTLHYTKMLVITLSNGIKRLIAFHDVVGTGYYSNDGYSFASFPFGIFADGDVYDYDFVGTVYEIRMCSTSNLSGGYGRVYYSNDGIGYTTIAGSSSPNGWGQCRFVKYTDNVPIVMAIERSTGDLFYFWKYGYLNFVTPPSPIRGNICTSQDQYYLYTDHNDSIVRRWKANLTYSYDSCTGLPVITAGLGNYDLVEFNNKVIAAKRSLGTNYYEEVYITEQDSNSFTPPNFKKLFVPFSNVISFAKIGIEKQNKNKKYLMIHCYNAATATIHRYITSDLETWTEWANGLINSILDNNFIEFRNNLYAFNSGILGSYGVNFKPLANISFKNTTQIGLATINGFHVDGKDENNFKSIYGIRGDVSDNQNVAIQMTAANIKYNSIKNQILNQIANIFGNSMAFIQNNILNAEKKCHNNIELHTNSVGDNVLHNIIINAKNIGVNVAVSTRISHNVIYNSYVGLYGNMDLIDENIFHKNSFDIWNVSTPTSITIYKNLFNGEIIGADKDDNNINYLDNMFNYDPLFIDENDLDFHIQTRERLADNGKYYSVDSICKSPLNPQPYPLPSFNVADIGAWVEHRQILAQGWDNANLENNKSIEVIDDHVDMRSGFSYTGSYLANFKEAVKKINVAFGDNRQIDYQDLHKIRDMLSHKGLKKLYPFDKGKVVFTSKVFNDSNLEATINPAIDWTENELVGKWAYIFNPASPLDGYFNMIRSNTKSSFIIHNNGNIPPSSTYTIEIVNCMLGFNGYFDLSAMTFELKHPISSNYISPNLAINVFKDSWLTIYVPSLSENIYLKIISNDGNKLYLSDEIGYGSGLPVSTSTQIGLIEFLYVRNEVTQTILKQLNSSDFKDGGSWFGVRADPKQYEYRLGSMSFYTVDEFEG